MKSWLKNMASISRLDFNQTILAGKLTGQILMTMTMTGHHNQ
jgi:hypothetical protein